MLRVSLIIAGLLLMAVQQFVLPFTMPAQLIIFLAGIVCLGIPHGAADLLIAGRNAEESNMSFSSAGFLISYLGRLVVFALVLWLFPFTGNILFICFAAYHFGETDLHHFKTDTISGKLMVIGYGLVILSAILVHHFNDVTPLLLAFHSGVKYIGSINWIDSHRFTIMLACFIFFLFSLLNYVYRYGRITRQHGLVLVQFVFIFYVLYNLPMMLAFSFYFILWHSVFSILNIVNYLREDGTLSYKKIMLQIAFYSSVAIAGMCFFGVIGYMFVSSVAITSYVFLGLAVLTAPHMQIMHEMYNHIRNKEAVPA